MLGQAITAVNDGDQQALVVLWRSALYRCQPPSQTVWEDVARTLD